MEKCSHPACAEMESLAKQCEIRPTKAQGPGGQHRNKVATAIVITHRPTGITGQASERRRQKENKDVAWNRLKISLAVGFRTQIQDISEYPSQLWKSRCLGGRISASPKNQDFACLLAESLDVIGALEFQMSAAAELLGCTTSQLVRFVKLEETAFKWINAQRKAMNLGILK